MEINLLTPSGRIPPSRTGTGSAAPAAEDTFLSFLAKLLGAAGSGGNNDSFPAAVSDAGVDGITPAADPNAGAGGSSPDMAPFAGAESLSPLFPQFPYLQPDGGAVTGEEAGGDPPAGINAGKEQWAALDPAGWTALLGATAALTGIPAGDIQLLLTGRAGGNDAGSGAGTGIPAGLPAGTARQAAELLYALLFNGQGDPAGVSIPRAAKLNGLFPAGVPENAPGTAMPAGPGLPGLQDPDLQQLRALLLQLLQPETNGRGSAGSLLPTGSGQLPAGEPAAPAAAPVSAPGGSGGITAAVLNQAGDLSPEQGIAASATGGGTAAVLDRLRTLLLQALTGVRQDGSGEPPRPEDGAALKTAVPSHTAGSPAQGGTGLREAAAALSTGPENVPVPEAAGGLFARQALQDAFPALTGRNQASTAPAAATAGQPGHLLAEPGAVQPANHPP
ncbi:MAG TPA: hypothetical protein GXX25_14690, partial [Desulfotomaculum sp.]|nr:hypothetical protein [Desulfotomaculum sp.]